MLKRFSIYNYSGLQVTLTGFTTNTVYFRTPRGINRHADKVKFLQEALYLKNRAPRTEKKTKKYVNRPVRAVNIYKYGKLYKECESLNEAFDSTEDNKDAVYKSLKKKTITKNNFTYEYANEINSFKKYNIYSDGKHLGSPTSKRDACKLLKCSTPTLNKIINLGEFNGIKIRVEERSE